MKFIAVLLGLNALWHSAAAYYFMRKPRGMLKRYLVDREGVELGKDVMQFLGGLNAGYVLLAILSLRNLVSKNKLDANAFWVLSLANFSQFFWDLIAHKNKRAKPILFPEITVPDGLFAFADALAALYILQKSK